jgi:hypothetical protein
LNADLETIEDAFDNTLSRDGTGPNQMLADLDLNGNQILNLPAPVDPNDAVRLQDLEAYVDVDGRIAAAEAAVVAAQLAETNAEAAEVAAELAETNAEAAAAQAEDYRDETAIYAGTTNMANFYANTTAGLAATASGAYFGTISTSSDGVLVYLDNAGTAVLQQTMPSINWHAKNQQVIKLEYVASGSTTNNPIFRPRFSWVVLSGGMYEVTFEVDEWPATNITGSEGITLQQYSGTPFITGGQFKMPDGSNIETGYLEAGKSVRFRRDTGSTLFEVILPPDPVTLPLSKALTATSLHALHPSPLRPVMMVKVAPYTWEVRVYKPVAHYELGTADRCHTDHDIYTLFDMGAFQTDTYAPALNSMGARRLDHEYRFAQHRFFDLISGIITDTGHVPSTFEAVTMSGDFADTGNTTNYQLAGIGHGHLESVSWTLYGTTNDASTSNVDVQSSDLKSAAVGTMFFGDKVVSTGVYYDESPTGERLCQRTMVHTFESADTHTCKVTNVFDPTVGGLEAPWGVREGGYAGMLPMRNVTRLRPLKVTPSTGAVTATGSIVNVNLQDSSQYNLTEGDGNWNAVEMWDHRQTVGGQVARARYVNNAGAGFTHWVGAILDANRVARAGPMFYKCETWGTKGYDPWYGNVTTKQDLSTSVITTSTAYLTIFGNLPT